MTFERVGLVAAWVLLLVLTVLVLRVLRLLRAGEELRAELERREHAEPLEVGVAGPDFRARYLDGSPVGLSDVAGTDTLLLFVSPACGSCRREMRGLVRLGRVAAERVGLRVVLVSDHKADATAEWIRDIRDVDGVAVDLPVIVAPPRASELVGVYNAGGVTPSYLLLGADGTVRARGRLGTGEWLALRAGWEGPTAGRRVLSARRVTG